MKTSKSHQIEPINQSSQHYEAAEGGLNLIDFKDKIIRQIHIVVGMTIFMSSLAFFSAIKRTPTYQAGFELLSERVSIETKVTSSVSQSRETTQEIGAVALDEVQIKNLKSPDIIGPIVTKLKLKYPEINNDSITSTLNLEADEIKGILKVVYQHSDREQVKDVLEELVKAYLNYSLKRRQSGVNRGLDFLNQQIPRIQTKVNILNYKIQELRKKYNIVNPQIQGSQISQRIDSFVIKQIEYQSQLEKTQKLAALAKKELNERSTTSTTAMLIGTSRYNALLEDIQKIDSEIAKKSVIFSDQSIQIQNLQEQRRAIVSLINLEIATIQQKIDNQIRLEKEQVQAINEEIANTQQNFQEWLVATAQYESIEREITITLKQLDELLIQREALRLESAQKEAPWKLLTLVGEANTNAASVANYIVLGTLLGLLIGVGAALLLESYKNLVYNPNQIQEITKQPILGIIPFNRYYRKLHFLKKFNSIISPYSKSEESRKQDYHKNYTFNNMLFPPIEAYTFLVSNLGLFEKNRNIRSLIITSTVSGEGKSTVALNLAKVIAATGTRVLVVDVDVRNPDNLTSTMALNAIKGLSDILSSDNLNTEINVKNVIQKSFLGDNLFILSSRNASNDVNTSRLLASFKMQDLMKELQQIFELVIYDVASIVDYADVNLLANHTDGVVLVTGLGKLPALKLREAISQLNTSKTPVLGVVINNLT
ncbi:MAG: AAA family ATPase [Goleter apudmare HA4340-LM2]|jgi:capsular exopolysaccharide synthesis family protein|nr:AAA family ATPase [Goleter apudmare HA4340-LM2]